MKTFFEHSIYFYLNFFVYQQTPPPFANKPSCLTVRPCYMHCGWTLKTSVTLQRTRFFD